MRTWPRSRPQSMPHVCGTRPSVGARMRLSLRMHLTALPLLQLLKKMVAGRALAEGYVAAPSLTSSLAPR